MLAALAVVLAWNTARAFNVYQDFFVTLSARPLAMGGAAAAQAGPESVFYNPAGLAPLRVFRLLYNHSARHFPGSTEGSRREWDQLDGDTEAIVVPLPLSTYAHGFILSGEMGYDYSGHPADGRLGYPREHYSGTESYDALAANFGLPCSAGIALRRHVGCFTPAPGADSPPWIRLGEGTQWGLLTRVWPGVDYGLSRLRMDYDWTVLDPAASAAHKGALPGFSSRLSLSRSGLAFHPAAWLTLTRDSTREDYKIRDQNYLGLIHSGSGTRCRDFAGGELALGALAKLRWGDYDGYPTSGLAFNLGGMWLNYAEVKGLLPEIVGSGMGFEDVHIYGFDLPLW
jgi:hypothetical protein